jgi:hypothetical protein
VLQGMPPKIGDIRGLGMAEHAKYATHGQASDRGDTRRGSSGCMARRVERSNTARGATPR